MGSPVDCGARSVTSASPPRSRRSEASRDAGVPGVRLAEPDLDVHQLTTVLVHQDRVQVHLDQLGHLMGEPPDTSNEVGERIRVGGGLAAPSWDPGASAGVFSFLSVMT